MSLFGRLLGRHRPRWQEAWQTYPGWVEGAAAEWSVDLGAVDAAPIANLPVRLDVEARHPPEPHAAPGRPEPHAAPGRPGPAAAPGLPGAADDPRLAELEQLVAAVAADLGGSFVGRVARAGSWRLTAHLPAMPTEPVSLAWRGDRELDIRAEFDPHWAYVRDRLAPDERQSQLLTDLALLGVLAEQGDELATPRQVEHVAYFARADPAESAAADLRADGFSASVERDDEGEFALTAFRRDPVAPPSLHEVTWAVKETVERHGGSYDGWNCAVTT